MTDQSDSANWSRRGVLAGLGAGVMLLAMPVRADDASVAQAITDTFGHTPRRDGKITLKLPPLAETGNTVPLTVTVDSPMSNTERVKRVVVFANRNPRPLIAIMTFGPKAATAEFSTNMRLSGTQDVIAMAELSDGSVWQTQVRVLVTVGACDTLQLRY
ncbi:MAG: SoxY [Devosia sp.]|uniref:thiosulfate oxidation carrier protein SoxY n=1 Tax=Devosia sp. TaxID=1871048 RepID=UPI0026315E9E|nr:thiosulfate oxidation carrier protein SoxY [Devosia sp.]MDB5527508.1 SoxY [Devosia sp.]